MRKYNIIFRACDAVASAHGRPRPFGLEKTELIQACFQSLRDAVRPFPHQIEVLGDRLSDQLLDFFSKLSIPVTNGQFGNDESIRATFRAALAYPDDEWVYFCEDDYLHRASSFLHLDEFIDRREQYLVTRPGASWQRFLTGRPERNPLFISLHDDPYNYRARKRRPSLVFRSAQCHWRQVGCTTFTFLTQVRWVRKYHGVLERSATGANDRYMSRQIYGSTALRGRALCVSPLPALATHLHEGQLSPGVDWKALLEERTRASGTGAGRALSASAPHGKLWPPAAPDAAEV